MLGRKPCVSSKARRLPRREKSGQEATPLASTSPRLRWNADRRGEASSEGTAAGCRRSTRGSGVVLIVGVPGVVRFVLFTVNRQRHGIVAEQDAALLVIQLDVSQ